MRKKVKGYAYYSNDCVGLYGLKHKGKRQSRFYISEERLIESQRGLSNTDFDGKPFVIKSYYRPIEEVLN